MRIIRRSEHVSVPWKNGGGTATDIIASPDGAGYEAFDWRLSGAHVGRAGQFSHFPGMDRTMFILSGGPLVLHGLAGGDAVLTTASEPFDFPGDTPVSATVPGGPVDNLNLMFDRRRFGRDARRVSPGAGITLTPKGVLLAYCERGEVKAADATLSPGDTIATETPLPLAGDDGSSVIIIDIWRK